MPMAYLLLSREAVISSTNSIKACDADMFDLNQYWLGLRMLYLNRKLSNLSLYNFSRIFENWGNKKIGL